MSAPEFEPPMASVNRVIRAVLPESMMMTKDAKAAFVRATAIFMFYLTHCANDYCKEGKRRTIQTNDVLNALKELGFEDFEAPMEEFLEAHRKQLQSAVKKPPSSGVKATSNASDSNNVTMMNGDEDDGGAADAYNQQHEDNGGEEDEEE